MQVARGTHLYFCAPVDLPMGRAAWLRHRGKAFLSDSILLISALGDKVKSCSVWLLGYDTWPSCGSYLRIVGQQQPCFLQDIAKYTNSTIGGLLNATFGNVTELVVRSPPTPWPTDDPVGIDSQPDSESTLTTASSSTTILSS